MKIQFNTDKAINGDEKQEQYFSSLIEKGLKRFETHLTRIEAHLSDQNRRKDGFKDMECLLEARIEGKQPIAVSCQANTTEQAVTGAINKLKTALETIFEKRNNHEK